MKKLNNIFKSNIFLLITILLFNNCSKPGFESATNLKSSTLFSSSSALIPLAAVPVPTPTPIPATVVPVVATVPVGSIPIFAAQGNVGRTMISCDQGQSWIANKSDDDSARCGTTVDCDHNINNGMGIAQGDSWLMATWGHGAPGYVRRSQDGVNWEKILDLVSYDGVGFANSKFVLFKDNAISSANAGTTWSPPVLAMPSYNIRATGTTSVKGAYFIGDGDTSYIDGTSSTLAMSDDGLVWSKPVNFPKDCQGGYSFGYSSGQGIILKNFTWDRPGYQMSNFGGLVCRSVDAGKNWTVSPIANFWMTNSIIFDGQKFITYGIKQPDTGKLAATSIDGINWTYQPISIETNGVVTQQDPYFGSIQYGNGVYVAVAGAYDKQRFFRSTNGILWHELPSSQFTKSHPIKNLIYGFVKKSSVCQ